MIGERNTAVAWPSVHPLWQQNQIHNFYVLLQWETCHTEVIVTSFCDVDATDSSAALLNYKIIRVPRYRASAGAQTYASKLKMYNMVLVSHSRQFYLTAHQRPALGVRCNGTAPGCVYIVK